VELGEGVFATCRLGGAAEAEESGAESGKADLSALTSKLAAKWKGGEGSGSKNEAARAGQVRSFRLVKLDPAAKKIEVELA
jgi:small subunit ribosomal protein S1